MGQLVTRLTLPFQNYSESVADILNGRRKRKRSIDSNNSDDEQSNKDQMSPKKKRLLTTTQYIYQALFKEQKNSDISVMALGKVWKLHKVYLSQSPYFYSMFNGSWREACQDFVHIKILDERVTLEALDAVFGSMYSDEIEIEPKAVVSILATATLFHLDGIIDKCAEVMMESINVETVVDCYEAGCQYGCLNAKKAAFKWLETNLLFYLSKNQKYLRQISVELMTELVSSPNLYVMQTEFSLYTLLRTWMYLRLHPRYDPENKLQQQQLQERYREKQNELEKTKALECAAATAVNDAANDAANKKTEAGAASTPVDTIDPIQSYFINRKDRRCSFLATQEGQQFVRPFQEMRSQYLTNHHMDLKIVHDDNIIPKEWLHEHVLNHWNAILKVDHLPEEGPNNLDDDIFNKNCMRCGRVLPEPGYQKWRWTGFNFGLDLIFIVDSRVLRIRRHSRAEHERLLSLLTKRQFMLKASVTSINEQRQPIFTQSTEIKSLTLEKNEELNLMAMDSKLVHPLLISISLLVVQPSNQAFKNSILMHDDDVVNALPISEIGTNCAERARTPTNGSSNADDSAVCMTPATSSSSNAFSTYEVSSVATLEVPSTGSLVAASSSRASLAALIGP